MMTQPSIEGNWTKHIHRPTFSGYKVTVDPLYTPVTVAEVKRELRLGGTAFDAQIQGMIFAACAHAEVVTGYDFVPRTYVQNLDYFPNEDIEIVNPPLQSVTSIKYVDTAGTQQTLASDQYLVDTNHLPGRISRAYSVSWPTIRRQNASVEITFVAGHDEVTGEAAGEIAAGAQTSILADTFTGTPKRRGVLYLENVSGQYETIAYTAVHEISGSYEFIVNDTLTYTYPDASTVKAFTLPEVWRCGILALVIDQFEHPEMSTEVLLSRNNAIMRIFKTGAYQNF